MVATMGAAMGDGAARLAARLAEEDRRERSRRLIAHLREWGDYQREGYDQPGIDYARPRVVGNAPGSQPPAPEWYLSLCAAIAALPEADERAIRCVYIYSDSHPRHPAAVAALLAAGLGED